MKAQQKKQIVKEGLKEVIDNIFDDAMNYIEAVNCTEIYLEDVPEIEAELRVQINKIKKMLK